MDQELDARGLNCPMPILKAKRILKEMAAGDVLAVLATDPGAVADFKAFCRVTGDELVESTVADGVFRFLIRKRG
jgi:tRNA 2-thiouridine synthesizing protein A